MCDYSLCGLPTRLARDGEELVAHRFRTGSMGLASPADLCHTAGSTQKGFWQSVRSVLLEDVSGPASVTAVCVPPGARLVLKDVPEDLQRRWNIRREEDAVFVQISANVYNYRDAVRFGNGTDVLLQSLPEGLRVEIVSCESARGDVDKRLAIPVV